MFVSASFPKRVLWCKAWKVDYDQWASFPLVGTRRTFQARAEPRPGGLDEHKVGRYGANTNMETIRIVTQGLDKTSLGARDKAGVVRWNKSWSGAPRKELSSLLRARRAFFCLSLLVAAHRAQVKQAWGLLFGSLSEVPVATRSCGRPQGTISRP